MDELLRILTQYNGVFQLIAITLVPIIIWIGSIWYQNRDAKKRLKQDLFLKLLANRKRFPISQEWVDALNQIDAVFQGNEKVRAAWASYFESLHDGTPKSQNTPTYLIELLSEIAKDLGYKNLTPSLLANFYSPIQFENNQRNQWEMNQHLLRVLQNSASFSSEVPPSDENKGKKERKHKK